MVFTKQRELKISLSKYFKTKATTGKFCLSRFIRMVTFEDYFHGLYNILDSVAVKNRSGALELLWRVTLHNLCKLLLFLLDFIHGIGVEPLVLTLGWQDNQLLAIYAVFGILGCCSTSSDLPFQRVRLYSLQCRLWWRWNESSSSTNRRGQGWSTHSNGCKYSHLSKHLWNAVWLAKRSRATLSTNQRLNQSLWLVQSISPRLATALCICFEMWLVHLNMCSYCDWSEG